MHRFGQGSRLAIVLPVIASLQVGNGWATDDTSGPSAPSKNNACPVTKPNGQGLPGADGTQGNHGDGAGLATSLWHGATVFKPGGPGCVGTDGSLWMKWPWWRGKRGPLSVSGQSVDGSPGAVKAAILPYGETGFQATALVFPGPGCWEVTGQVGDATISFVVEAVKVAQGPQSPCDALFPAAAIRSLR